MPATRWPVATSRSGASLFIPESKMAVAQFWYPSRTRAAVFRKKTRNNFLSLSSPRKRREWALVYPSVGPSSPRIEESYGPQIMPIAARRFTSVFPQLIQTARWSSEATPRSMNTAQPVVFVIDDYAPIRNAITRLLRASGFIVAPFASADAFLAQYDPGAAGCLVLDLAMPAVSGLELQDVLAQTGSLLPIIFLTAHGSIPQSVQAMKQGA